MVGIRMTLKLEAPVAFDGQQLVDESYIDQLTTMTTNMFEENFDRIRRFERTFRQAIQDKAERQSSQTAKQAAKDARRKVW